LSPVFESSIANENINENLGDVGEMAPPKILTPSLFFFQTYELSASVHTGISGEVIQTVRDVTADKVTVVSTW
jgi:hypothetical protein